LATKAKTVLSLFVSAPATITPHRRGLAEEAMPHNYQPTLSAVDLMLDVLDIKGWRQLLEDPILQRETQEYTRESGSMPAGNITPEMLPPFMTE